MRNPGRMIAMLGQDCVAIAMDNYKTEQQDDAISGQDTEAVNPDFKKIFRVGQRVFVGFDGLEEDVMQLHKELKTRRKIYERREKSRITPSSLSKMLSNFLFEYRFGAFNVDSMIAGIDRKSKKPYVCAIDPFGHHTHKEFVVLGDESGNLKEKFQNDWRPDLAPDELFEVIGRALVTGMKPGELSGWTAQVFILEKNKLTQRSMQGR